MSAFAPQRLRTDGASQHTLRMPQAVSPRSSADPAQLGLSSDGGLAPYVGLPPLSSPRRRPPQRRGGRGEAVGEGVPAQHTGAVYLPAEAAVSGPLRQRNVSVEAYVEQSSILAGPNDSPRRDVAPGGGPGAYAIPTAVRSRLASNRASPPALRPLFPPERVLHLAMR